jgi:hypothetical protein
MTVLRSNPFRSGVALSLVLVLAAPGAVIAQEDPAAVIAQEDPAAVVAQEAPAAGGAVVASEDPADGPVIQTLGEADQKIFLVDHNGTWSMHFENVMTGNVVLQWKQAGGPDVTMKMPVDRPFTMSVHKVAPEVIVERLFEGYGYTLHYDDAQRLTSVRVYSPRDSLVFKTPRLTQSLSDWKKAETEPAAASPTQP